LGESKFVLTGNDKCLGDFANSCKLSDFQDQVDRHTHLRGLKMKQLPIGFYHHLPTTNPIRQSIEKNAMMAMNGLSPASSFDGLPNGLLGPNVISRA
jgi:hypothetical protein